MTIRITGTFNATAALKEIQDSIDEDIKSEVNKRGDAVYNQILNTTPVDTGKLKSGWDKKSDSEGLPVISNNVKYVKHVEEGTTRRAGRHFIKTALLVNGFSTEIDY